MDLFEFIFTFINQILFSIASINFILLLFLVFLLSQILLFIFKDKKQISKLKDLISEENFDLNKLKEQPLVNIVVPAWKEGSRHGGKEFNDCLFSIAHLKYPRIKAIVNAGGDDRTIEIAETYRENKDFVILRQKGGKSRAAFGKIVALNDCLSYIDEGIIFFIDADCYITDDHLNRMIFPIVNLNEDVVSSGYRPLDSIMNYDFVRYVQFYKYNVFNLNLERYSSYSVCGSNTVMKTNVMEKIGKFHETGMIAEDISRGRDILSKGFKILALYNYKSFMHTEFPNKIKELIAEKRRHIENSIFLSLKNKKYMYIFKILILVVISLFILITPLFLFFNIGLFFIGIVLFLSFYVKSIRKYIFFKKIVEKEDYPRFPLKIFIKMIFYTYIGILTNILALFGLRSFFRSIKNE